MTKKQEEELDKKLNELFPQRGLDYTDPETMRNMFRDFWSSRIDRLTKELRKVDQAQAESLALSMTKVVI